MIEKALTREEEASWEESARERVREHSEKEPSDGVAEEESRPVLEERVVAGREAWEQLVLASAAEEALPVA